MKYNDLIHKGQLVQNFNGVIKLPKEMKTEVDNINFSKLIKDSLHKDSDICNVNIQRIGNDRKYTDENFHLLVHYKNVDVNALSSLSINYSMIIICFE